MKYTRYSYELLKPLIEISDSFSEVLRKLGKKPVGGSITNLKLMCERYNIDFSHMKNQGHMLGKRSKRRRPACEVLVEGTSWDHRVAAKRLRAALDEIGRKFACEQCGNNGWWRGEQLMLEIDHIDGCYWNNVPENLRYLCPNCHSIK